MDDPAVARKRQQEKDILCEMIDIYCAGNGHVIVGTGQTIAGNDRAIAGNGRASICSTCTTLKDYARKRVDDCPHMATKSFCSVCQTHCYDPEHREAVRQVMRFSARRFFLRRPVKTLSHALCTLQARLRQKKAEGIHH